MEVPHTLPSALSSALADTQAALVAERAAHGQTCCAAPRTVTRVTHAAGWQRRMAGGWQDGWPQGRQEDGWQDGWQEG